MAITVEDGTGVAGAESYATAAKFTAYWGSRTHHALYATASGADLSAIEGALREASAYLDATYGALYRGRQRGTLQGLLWPRTGAFDDAGYPLPDLPREIVNATCELAVRALSSTLAADADPSGIVTRERKKVGPIEKETEFSGGTRDKRYGYVHGLLAPVLNGAQSGAVTWNWR